MMQSSCCNFAFSKYIKEFYHIPLLAYRLLKSLAKILSDYSVVYSLFFNFITLSQIIFNYYCIIVIIFQLRPQQQHHHNHHHHHQSRKQLRLLKHQLTLKHHSQINYGTHNIGGNCIYGQSIYTQARDDDLECLNSRVSGNSQASSSSLDFIFIYIKNTYTSSKDYRLGYAMR